MTINICVALALLGAILVKTARTDACNTCCLCGPKPISVTIRVQNNKVTPHFNHTLLIKMKQRELLYFLQAAADKQPEFRFSADYGQYGYFINTMNGLEADYNAHETWWKIVDGYNIALNKGVSSYIPSDQDIITFEYVQGQGK